MAKPLNKRLRLKEFEREKEEEAFKRIDDPEKQTWPHADASYWKYVKKTTDPILFNNKAETNYSTADKELLAIVHNEGISALLERNQVPSHCETFFNLELKDLNLLEI
jgi:hypothetical protein